MNLEKLNNWLTLGANLGVLIGIILLAQEIRITRESSELQALDSRVQGYDRFNEILASNSDSANTFAKGLYNPSALTDGETVQFSMLLLMFQNQANQLRVLRNSGQATDEDFQHALKQYAALLGTPGGRVFRENWPGFNEGPWATAIEPYLAEPPIINFVLDRNPEEIGQ